MDEQELLQQQDQIDNDPWYKRIFDPSGNPQNPAWLEAIQEKKASGDIQIERMMRERANLDAITEAIGAPPVPESEPGLWYKLMDTIDTPRQWIAGNIARGVGHPGYEGLSPTEAMAKSSENDLTTGEMLRENPWFRKHPGWRGLAGFVGDMATDPLSYLSAFPQGARLGGVAVSDAVLSGGKNAQGIFKALQEAEYARLLAKEEDVVLKSFLKQGTEADSFKNLMHKGLVSGEDYDHIMQQALADSRRNAGNKFRELKALDIKERLYQQSGATDLLEGIKGQDVATVGKTDALRAAQESGSDILGVAAQKQRLLGEMSLTSEDLNKIFRRPAIRFSGLFAGGGEVMEHIPLLGGVDLDIPGVTDISEVLFKQMGNLYYGTPLKIQRFIGKGLQENPNSPVYNALNFASRAMGTTRDGFVSGLGLISKRIRASGRLFGSNAPSEVVTDAQRAAAYIPYQAYRERERVFGDLQQRLVEAAGSKPEDAVLLSNEAFADISKTIQGGLHHGAAGAKTKEDWVKSFEGAQIGTKHLAPRDIVEDQKDFQKGLQELRDRYNTRSPGLGDDLADTVEEVRRDFYKMWAKESEEGVLDSSLDGYLPQIYQSEKGMEDPNAYSALRRLYGGKLKDPDFALERVYATMEQAKRAGFKPVEDIRDLYFFRLAHHKRALAEKEFSSRLALEWSMNGKAYDALRALTIAESDNIKRNALYALHKLDTPVSYADIPFKLRDENGMWLDLDRYDAIAETLRKADDPMQAPYVKMSQAQSKKYAEAMGMKEKTGLKFDATEREQVAQFLDATKRARAFVVGREGESALTRAGAAQLEDIFKNKIFSAKNVTEEDKQFWSGLIPSGLASIVKDSFRAKGTLEMMAEKMSRDPATAGMAKALSGTLRFFNGWTKALKVGATVVWPGYWVRNVVGGQFQGGLATSVLGQMLNIPRIVETQQIIHGGKNLVTRAGVTYSSQEIRNLLGRYGVQSDVMAAADLISAYGEALKAYGDIGLAKKALPTTERLFQRMQGKKGKLVELAEQVSPAAAQPLIEGGSAMAKVKSTLSVLGAKMESTGREHLFVNLLREGYDPESAAHLTSKLLVDYAHGKTAIEKDFLNQLFFFYSFSRGQSTNNFVQMMLKPGNLTAQLHAHKAVAEMLTDPDNMPEDIRPDDPRISTTRTAKDMTTFIGMNPETGLPLKLSSTGLPVEDMTRFFTLRRPKRWTMNDVYDAGFGSVGDELRTLAGQMNPLFKSINEAFISQKNFYFDRPITDETIRRIPMWQKDINVIGFHPWNALPRDVWKGLDEGTKWFLGGKENGDGTMTINPFAMVVLTNLVPGAARFLNTKEALSKPGVGKATKLLRLMSGVQYQEIDAEKSKVADDLRRAKEYMQVHNYPTTRPGLERYLQYEGPEEDDTDTDEGE